MARSGRTLAKAALLGCLGALAACDDDGGSDPRDETTFLADGPLLFMSGVITSDTLDQFEDVIADHPQMTTLVECIVPGSADDDTMIALSYQVREMGLRTHLTSQSQVASGGTDLFLAGVQRTMVAGADIGVHSWSDGENDAADFPRTSPEHDANRDYIADMLGDEAFYWFTIYAAAAADMHWMTGVEIADYGLLTEAVAPADTDIICPDFGAERLID